MHWLRRCPRSGCFPGMHLASLLGILPAWGEWGCLPPHGGRILAQGCRRTLALRSWTPFTLKILNVHLYMPRGLPSGSVERIHCQHRRHGIDPWVGKTPWRRKWQPTPVFLPGEFHGQRSLAATVHGVSEESDTTEHTHTYVHTLYTCQELG